VKWFKTLSLHGNKAYEKASARRTVEKKEG
jgi:hypothetical protein